jgi:hypothetical protein
MNSVDDDTIKEFLDYYSETVIPDPEQYPKRFEFMVKAFNHSKKIRSMRNENRK